MKPEYFARSFKLGENDCWTFVQDIFKNEHGIALPDLPAATDTNQDMVREFGLEKLNMAKVPKAEKGCIIVFRSGRFKWHCGYALNSTHYFHHSRSKVTTSLIPKNADIYKVLDV